MNLDQLFKLKYDLLEQSDASDFETLKEKEAFKKGYEKALHAFFMNSLNEILEQQDKKKAG
jgi:hypothetical protein